MSITVEQLNRQLTDRLTKVLGRNEAAATMRIVWEDVMNYSPSQLIVRGDHVLEPFTVQTLRQIVERVEQGMPVQYAVGRADFMGMSLKVDSNTLIPRPETAELVDMIIDRCGDGKDLKVLDIGTGSGCIAIALARGLKFPDVTAIDISEGALLVAAENARNLKANVRFLRADALKLCADHPLDEPRGSEATRRAGLQHVQPLLKAPFDIIVSNPPYVLASEAAGMQRSVLGHEPHTALFVPDDDPLRFYTAIADYASGALKPGGALFFEINPLCARQLADRLTAQGWQQVEIHLDFYKRQRFITAVHN